MEEVGGPTEKTPLGKAEDDYQTTSAVSTPRKRTLSYLTSTSELAEEDGVAQQYDMQELITWRVFGVLDGTVFQSRTLWMETFMTGALFWGLVGVLYWRRWENFSEFVGKESTIRAFIAMFSTLIGFLLCFYTALNMGRWWNMRVGVHSIQEGCKTLVLLVSNGVTGDTKLIETIHRYARCSLFFIFQASVCQKHEQPRLKAVDAGLLDEDEAQLLEDCNPHMPFVQAETLWVWLGNAISRLHDQGFTKGAPHYCQLMAAVDKGRNGIETIQSYLETPIPLGYVHLLCWMVKLHNVILTILMALACVMHTGGDRGFRIVGVLRTAFRAFFMPFLYNAILILNAEVIDPFGEDKADFKFEQFDVNLALSSESFRKAALSVPSCLALEGVKGIPK